MENNKLKINDLVRSRGKEKVLVIAGGILLLSILLMVIVIPGVYAKTLPDATNIRAVTGISLAIFFRLLIIGWYTSTIKRIRRGSDTRKIMYIIIGIFLIFLGLLYSDGALAFMDNKNIIYVSYLMFTSFFFDVIASILTIIAIFIKPQRIA